MLLLWPGVVRRKREDDFGRIGPALFAGTNISDQSVKAISSTSYSAHVIDMSLFLSVKCHFVFDSNVSDEMYLK